MHRDYIVLSQIQFYEFLTRPERGFQNNSRSGSSLFVRITSAQRSVFLLALALVLTLSIAPPRLVFILLLFLRR